jgi:undecaprenyl-phosphate 4-deoxy-4-formamido-L-arabinose transferase
MVGSISVTAEVDETAGALPAPHLISIVIPVYQGEKTLAALLQEIDPLRTPFVTESGHLAVVHEVVLVFDHGPDDSARVIRQLTEQYSYVRAVWLSKNYGQHAATLAGMASAGGEWIATIDEDGQHDPKAIATLLDTAMAEQASIVYAKPTNAAPHGFLRNISSKGAKWILAHLFVGSRAPEYQSFRLVVGDVGRSVAAYAGSNVYLDVALSWVAGSPAVAPVALRDEGDRRSGYSTRRLLSHFWRMVLTSGTRGLRVVSGIGTVFAIVGLVLTVWVIVSRLFGHDVPEGWASTIIVVLFSSGAILFALGVIAEYVGVSVNMALGKPAYLVVSDPANGPLGRPALRK